MSLFLKEFYWTIKAGFSDRCTMIIWKFSVSCNLLAPVGSVEKHVSHLVDTNAMSIPGARVLPRKCSASPGILLCAFTFYGATWKHPLLNGSALEGSLQCPWQIRVPETRALPSYLKGFLVYRAPRAPLNKPV